MLLSWAGAALAFASTLAAQSQEVATPAPAPPASAPSREAPHWVVRVAAFYKQENVAEGAERLKKAGFPVVIEEYTPRVGKSLTLLLAGPYPDRQTAEAAAAKLQGLGWSGSVQRYAPSPSAVARAAAPTPAPRPAETNAETPPGPAPGPVASEPAASERVAAEVLVVAKAPPTPAEAPAPARPPEGDSIPKVSLASAQGVPYGRVALFGNLTQFTRSDLGKSTLSQWSAALTLHSASNQNGGFEYGLDFRGSQYIDSNRSNLASLYNAYVGARTSDGVFGARLGQMWIDEIGSLGAVGGVYLSLAQKNPTAIGRFRLGLFGGVDPKVQEVGYFEKVRKAGAFVALDGLESLRSVLGYVQVRNDNLLERSVVVLNNFIPIGRTISIYQAGEYDIAPPAGQGKSGLNYFLVNARWQASRVIELQALYHYGRSIDARSLSDDQINGRPIDPRLLEGFLFESAGGRVTFSVTPTVRLYAGYAAEKRNRSDATIGRITGGLFAGNLFRSGFDLSVSESRYQRTGGEGNDNALYVSLGRSIGPQIYLTAEYSTSVAFLQFTDAGGVTVVSQPSFQRYALSGVANLTRAFSLLLTLEHITGDLKEDEANRALLGLAFRF